MLQQDAPFYLPEDPQDLRKVSPDLLALLQDTLSIFSSSQSSPGAAAALLVIGTITASTFLWKNNCINLPEQSLDLNSVCALACF